MKKAMIVSLMLITVISLSFMPATNSLVKAGIEKKKKTDVNLCNLWVSENSLNGKFHGHIEISGAVCEDVYADIRYTVNSVIQYHTLVIPAYETSVDDEWGSCPAAYQSEGLNVDLITPSVACGVNIYW